MKSGTCPKCASTDVRFKKGHGQHSYVSLGLLSNARLVDYICPDCGYTEQYIDNLDQAASLIRSKWQPVRNTGTAKPSLFKG